MSSKNADVESKIETNLSCLLLPLFLSAAVTCLFTVSHLAEGLSSLL